MLDSLVWFFIKMLDSGLFLSLPDNLNTKILVWPLISLGCDLGEGERLVWGPCSRRAVSANYSNLGRVAH